MRIVSHDSIQPERHSVWLTEKQMRRLAADLEVVATLTGALNDGAPNEDDAERLELRALLIGHLAVHHPAGAA